ncbi:S1 family peptidase [Streptomyces chartreusis]|uniref:S1 family peptidase n=1 Tax=Streptomyces TaxID=1883 RepID=UPI002E813A97|nr:S1 family peptidase [Streptomyces chartreusis]WSZ70713.1 S1 family peptidase [Streptomyces chartreusis]WTA26306.1 S1 family peptidase [Streptomyces chartreusis]WUB16949.1 S1 family peptidase [Streptomyces chartreusis]
MKHRRIPKRRAAVAGAGIAALVAAGVTLQTANASETPETSAPKTLSVSAAGKLASALVKDLGGDAAGSYYDTQAKSLVVNVLDEAAADAVEAAGAKARVVENSLAELKSARTTLKQDATIPGTAWVTDPATNKVVVTADRTVSEAEWAKLGKVVDGLGAKAELKRSKGEYKPFVAGGDAITGGSGRCSLGFNVVKGGEPFFLTAGHCTESIKDWSDSNGTQIGSNESSSFPDNDYGLVKYTAEVEHPSEVNLYNGSTQAISGAAEATVGMEVTRSGSTTQVHDGKVTGLDATVNYGNGDIVNGLIQTDVCAEPGDSGGSLFSGDKAIGLTSGGSGDCTSGGETFFQPVTEALSATGTEIG